LNTASTLSMCQQQHVLPQLADFVPSLGNRPNGIVSLLKANSLEGDLAPPLCVKLHTPSKVCRRRKLSYFNMAKLEILMVRLTAMGKYWVDDYILLSLAQSHSRRLAPALMFVSPFVSVWVNTMILMPDQKSKAKCFCKTQCMKIRCVMYVWHYGHWALCTDRSH